MSPLEYTWRQQVENLKNTHWTILSLTWFFLLKKVPVDWRGRTVFFFLLPRSTAGTKFSPTLLITPDKITLTFADSLFLGSVNRGTAPTVKHGTQKLKTEHRTPNTEHRRPKAEDRRPKTEGRRPKTEGRRPKVEDRRSKTEGRRPIGFVAARSFWAWIFRLSDRALGNGVLSLRLFLCTLKT